jgi:hypothetical protein
MVWDTGALDGELEEEATSGVDREGALGAPRAASDGAAMAAEDGTPAGAGVVMATVAAETDSVEAMAGNMHKIKAVSVYHVSKERESGDGSRTVFHITITYK